MSSARWHSLRAWRWLACVLWLAGALVWLYSTGVLGDLRSAPSWYDQNAVGIAPDWHYRVPVTIPAGTPVNSTIRVNVDFNALLAQMGVSGTFDANSPRIVRSTGALATQQEFTDAVYGGGTDGLSNGRGEVRFILQDAGPVTYHIYFDITANGAKAANPQTPINGGFEFGGTGTEDPPGWSAVKANANFDAQVRPSENPVVTTTAAAGGGSAALPSATRATDGTPYVGNFSYMIGSRTNSEPGNANPSVTVERTMAVPTSCPYGFRLRYRIEGWDSSQNGAGTTLYDFLRIRLIGGGTTELVGPPAGGYTTQPFSPNFRTSAATTTASGYRQYNGWDTDTNGNHRSGMTVAPQSEPWWQVTDSLGGYLGQTVTLRITSSSQLLYKSWYHIDDIEWCVVDGTLGTPAAFGANITAPAGAASFTPGQNLAVTVQVDAAPTGAGSPVVAYVYDPLGNLVTGPVALAPAGSFTYSNASVYTFASGDPGGTWTVRVYARDASNSTVGATNGLARIPGQPSSPQSQANFYNVDEQTFTFTPPPSNPGSFNAFEPSTAAGAVAGVIRTKVVGVAFTLDVVAILSGAQFATFNNDVRVELLGNSATGVSLDAQNCPTSFTLLQTVSPAPIAGGRSSVNFAAVPNSWRDVRVRIRYPVGSPTVTSCSTDNFAIRPASIAIAATDTDWSTAGTTRALANAAATGGNVHKAGRPFTITVAAQPVSATNYDGDPVVSQLACTVPAVCANGTLALGAFAGAGSRVSNTATYSEAGAFDLNLIDQNYASVDAGDGTPADCSAAGRYVCQTAPAAVGRFVPDRFEFIAPATPLLRTFNTTACGPRSFTYIGQPFWYETLPSATLNAVNAAGTVTTNYSVTGSKPAIAEAYSDASAPPSAPLNATAIGSAFLTAGAGTGVYSASPAVGARLSYDRPAAAPVGPFAAVITLIVTANDSTEAPVSGNGTISTPVPLTFDGGGGGIAFDAGAQLRYGRLYIGSASGSTLLPLPLPVETQYWNGTSFATNTADHCTTLATANFALASHAGNLGAGETTPVLAPATVAAGKASLTLSAPGAGNDGSVDIVANLGASVDACVTLTPPPAPGGAGQLWLRGRWCGTAFSKDPVARATFGVRLGAEEIIYMRENF